MGILLLNNVTDQDLHSVGEKVVKLAKLKDAFPMPMGFVVDKNVFNDFLRQTDLLDKIKELENSINLDDKEDLQLKVNKIQQMLVSTEMPNALGEIILDQYDAINIDDSKPLSEVVSDSSSALVAVRASSVGYVDDKKLHMSFLNISGRERLLKAVQTVFASFYTSKAVSYRLQNNITGSGIAVFIQKMIPSDASGIAYSTNPTNHEHMLVLACKGLGSAITNNVVIPDRYVLEKDSLEIVDMAVKKQEFMFTNDNLNNKTVKKPLRDRDSLSQKMTTKQIQDVARRAKRIEKEFGRPQLVEFALEKDNFYILQALNIEGLNSIPEQKVVEEVEETSVVEETPVVPEEPKQEETVSEGNEEEQTSVEDIPETETEDIVEEENEKASEYVEDSEECDDDSEETDNTDDDDPDKEDSDIEEVENTENPIEEIREASPMFEDTANEEGPIENTEESIEEDIENKLSEEKQETSASVDDDDDDDHEIIIAKEPDDEYSDEDEAADEPEVQNIAEQLATESEDKEENTQAVFKETPHPHDPKTMMESTFQKAGSVVVSAHMAIQSALYKKYLNKYGEEPTSFEQVMEKLKQENMIEHENEIIRLRQIYVDYLQRQIDPSPKDIKFALELMQKFCN